MTTGVAATPRVEATLRRLELDVFRRLDGLLQGDHLGLVPAPGSEAGESREYTPGDDVRRMDWAVTARTTIPHVRDTIADRELETWVVVDRSASLDFGTAQFEKRDLALAMVAAVGFLTSRAGNRVGALVLGNDKLSVVPARGGREAMLALLHQIDATPRAEQARTPVDNLHAALRRVPDEELLPHVAAPPGEAEKESRLSGTTLHVVAAVVERDGCFLVTQRLDGLQNLLGSRHDGQGLQRRAG